MQERTFAAFVIDTLACVSMLGVCAVLHDRELARNEAWLDARKWKLPRSRRRSGSPEDDCRHCSGSGLCVECAPEPCRVCCGDGVQPQDEGLVNRLSALWDGAA